MAAQNNLMIEAGTDYESIVYIGVGDASYSFTNKEYRATLNATYGGGTHLSFSIKEDSANKKITLSLPQNITATLASGIWYWDLIENESKTYTSSNNAFTTVNGDATIGVNWTDHGLTSDDRVVITSSSSLPGGFLNGGLNGTKTITIVDDNNFTFEAGQTANASSISPSGTAVFNSLFKTSRLLEGDVLVTPYVTNRTDGEAST